MITFDQATVDSSGAFLIGELERLDQTLNLPLVGYTWTRDIQLREDVSIADDISSWTNTSFAAAGTGANPNGKNWVGKDSTAIAGVNVDIGKSGNPLNLWGMELGWTVIELQAAQQVGRPIDTQKYDGMQLKWQMDNDEQVYVGDSALNLKGLVTLDGVPVNNAAKTWATSTPDEIRASINQVLSDAWAASGYSVVPRDLLIPPEQFALLSSIIVSSAGNQSLLTYLQTNTISYHQNGVPLNIRAVKWLKGRGVGKRIAWLRTPTIKNTSATRWFRFRACRCSIAVCIRSSLTTASWVRLSQCTKKPFRTLMAFNSHMAPGGAIKDDPMAKNNAVIHVHTPFVLTLPDGSRREFVKGRHAVEEDVATHWFTRAHAEVSVGKATDARNEVKNAKESKSASGK